MTANTADSGVRTMQADVFTYYKLLSAECADLIISNPPYLTGPEMGALMPETAHEPAMALDGGADGLDFYRLLTTRYKAALRPGGWLVMEIGYAQAADVLALGEAHGWSQRQLPEGLRRQRPGCFAAKIEKPPENPVYGTQNAQQNVVICS